MPESSSTNKFDVDRERIRVRGRIAVAAITTLGSVIVSVLGSNLIWHALH